MRTLRKLPSGEAQVSDLVTGAIPRRYVYMLL